MNIVQKQDFDVALREMEVHPTVIQTKTGDYPVGTYAIFDKQNQLVYATIKRKYTFVQNRDLFDLLWTHEATRCLKIYTSKGGETYGFDGFFPNKFYVGLPPNHRLGFNIMNSYSGRFFPRITFSLVDTESDIIIRTPLNIFEKFTKDSFSKELRWQVSSELLTNTLGALKVSIDYYTLKDYFPNNIKPYFDKYVVLYTDKHKQTSWGALKLVALLTKQWSKTSYESATSMQRQLYTVIMEMQNERTRQTAKYTL